jgi:hypothetical protein
MSTTRKGEVVITADLCLLATAALALVWGPSVASAQTLAERIAATPNGSVRFHFAGKPGVCGDGADSLGQRRHAEAGMLEGDDGDASFYHSGHASGRWHARCVPGPLQVTLDLRAGVPQALRATAGPLREPPAGVADLGRVGAADAADWLVGVARSASGNVARSALVPAVLADSATVWPALLRLARDASLPRETRKRAIFWVGQIAAENVGAELGGIATDDNEDLDVREHAVFALSQRPARDGVPALLDIARTSRSRELRKTAMFWLAQSGDERAVVFFEQILLRP